MWGVPSPSSKRNACKLVSHIAWGKGDKGHEMLLVVVKRKEARQSAEGTYARLTNCRFAHIVMDLARVAQGQRTPWGGCMGPQFTEPLCTHCVCRASVALCILYAGAGAGAHGHVNAWVHWVQG